MTPKIERTITEITKIKDKIMELQTRLKALGQKKIFLENEEIVALCRKENLSEDDLAAYIMSRRGAVVYSQSAQMAPSPDPAVTDCENKEGSGNEE